jgi:branched-chain amino acid transport system ATP-binding protein
MAALLELVDVHTYYGAIHALRGVSLTVDEGEIVTLIGSNGAGKSTTLRTISGLLRPRQGEIRLRGERIDGRKPHEIVALGVCQSPEGRRVFARMNIQENLEMGAFARRDRAGLVAEYEKVYDLFPRLRERKLQKAGTLSGGEQQMLAIGRALMAAPKVLLLDEERWCSATARTSYAPTRPCARHTSERIDRVARWPDSSGSRHHARRSTGGRPHSAGCSLS